MREREGPTYLLATLNVNALIRPIIKNWLKFYQHTTNQPKYTLPHKHKDVRSYQQRSSQAAKAERIPRLSRHLVPIRQRVEKWGEAGEDEHGDGGLIEQELRGGDAEVGDFFGDPDLVEGGYGEGGGGEEGAV